MSFIGVGADAEGEEARADEWVIEDRANRLGFRVEMRMFSKVRHSALLSTG